MGEIEVNEYVRTKNGYIAKLIKIEKCLLNENKVDYIFDNNIHKIFFEETSVLCEDDLYKIIKHSKNIIDLVELKDLVCFKNKLQNSLENEEMIIHIFDNDTLEEVKQAIEKGEIELLEILTHEQFEQNSYRVGDKYE